MADSSPIDDAPPPAAAEANATYDFSAAAGPLPTPVIARIAAACRNWRGCGSALSLPFTSEACRELMRDTRARMCRVLAIPGTHDVLFLQGGASAQFSLVPLNLLGQAGSAAYLISGYWSRRAMEEAGRYCNVRALDWNGASDWEAPWLDERRIAYLHVTSNETADGTQLRELPHARVPLAIDMTSDVFTRHLPWERIGVAYCAMQKAIGVAGLTLVVVRRDLLGRARAGVPCVFDYAAQSTNGSRVNTPPMFALFVAHAVLEWIDASGGLPAVSTALARRSRQLYKVIDSCASAFHADAPSAVRSPTSICFDLRDPHRARQFSDEAQRRGIAGLAGHSKTGGLRAANYIGTSDAAISRLCDLLADFTAPR